MTPTKSILVKWMSTYCISQFNCNHRFTFMWHLHKVNADKSLFHVTVTWLITSPGSAGQQLCTCLCWTQPSGVQRRGNSRIKVLYFSTWNGFVIKLWCAVKTTVNHSWQWLINWYWGQVTQHTHTLSIIFTDSIKRRSKVKVTFEVL